MLEGLPTETSFPSSVKPTMKTLTTLLTLLSVSLIAQEGTQGSNLGDVFNYNAAVSYRLLGACSEDEPHEPGVTHEHSTTLDLIFEANGDARGRVYEEGFIDANTGGNLVFLSGGTRLAWGHGWAATASLGAPILDDLNGIQSEPVMRILFGISKAF